jgi:hypothetical protein
MSKTNTNKHARRTFSALAIICALMVGALFALPKAQAGKPTDTSYGPGAVYQIELVAQTPGGGGAWLWIALYPNGTADYAGSDCAGGSNGSKNPGIGPGEGAGSDRGDATWHYTDDCKYVVIEGVMLNGFPVPFSSTITVPSTYGHYSCMDPGCLLGAYMTWPTIPGGPNVGDLPGFSQLEVAGGQYGTTPPCPL